MIKTIFGTFTFCAALLLAFAPTVSVVQAAPKAEALLCPVTHLPIGSTAVAVGKSTYKGKTYYFCTSNCKRLFDKSPAKYAKSKK
jgi:YHS domain-containing protein